MLPAGIVIPHLVFPEAGDGVPETSSRLLWSKCLVELNIGHSLVSRAVMVGLETAVKEILSLMKKYRA
jgi:pyridoxine 5-phosphate synthase